MLYKFSKPLIEAVIIKRLSQFTMLVDLNGEQITAHCPTTGRIGDIETKNIACLLSKSDDIKRKMPYTVEAISCDELDRSEKRWVGINQILSNRLIEFFFTNHELDEIENDYDEIRREVKLGISKLDFKIGNTYLEVKTPLTQIQVEYGKNIKTKPVTPFSSTERFTKHINELANSLKNHERAFLVSVYQYIITAPKERQHSTNYEVVSKAVENAYNSGVGFYDIQMNFTPIGVELYKTTKTQF